MIFLRQLYKQKPQQWGPLSAVRNAVFRNAEEVYGIDKDNIIAIAPFWENQSGVTKNVYRSYELISGTHDDWGPQLDRKYLHRKGIYLDRKFINYQSKLTQDTAHDALSFICRIDTWTSSRNRGIIDTKNGTTGDWANNTDYAAGYRSDGGLFFRIGNVGSYTYTDYVFSAGYHDLAYRWETGNYLDIFCDGEEVSYDNHAISSGYTAGSNALRIGCYYDNTREDYRFQGLIFYYVLLKQRVDDNQIALFKDLPYQLFAPNPGKLYFDMGAVTSSTTSVESDVQLLFDLAERVSSPLQVVYNIKATADSGLQIKYDILSAVDSDLELPYDIRDQVSSLLQLVYDIEGALSSVESDAQFVYDIRAIVANDIQLLYDILATVESGLTTRYNILSTVANSLGIEYDIRALVDSDVELIFDLRGVVDSDVQLLFDMAGKVASDVQIVYDLGFINKPKRGLGLFLKLRI